MVEQSVLEWFIGRSGGRVKDLSGGLSG